MIDDIKQYIDYCCDRYLSYRPRTEYEMRTYIKRKLSQKRFDLSPVEVQSLIDQKVKDLLDSGIVNDVSFAKWYLQEKTIFKPRGFSRIKYELAQKGISRHIIAEIMEERVIDEKDMILELLQRYSRVDYTDQKNVQKLIQKLGRKGFSYGDIKRAIEEYTEKE